MKPFAKIELPKEYLAREAFEHMSFSANGQVMIPIGSTDVWHLIEARKDGTLVYGLFPEDTAKPERVH